MAIDSELIAQILYFASPVLSLIIIWLSRNENIFNFRKIQQYDVWDYQYTVFLFQAFYSAINPMIFFIGFFFANWASAKLETNYYLQLMLMVEIYAVIIIVAFLVESEVLSKRKDKLKIISSSMSDEFSKMMLSVDVKKDTVYKTNMCIFSMIWLILIMPLNSEVISGAIFFWIIYYAISVIFMLKRYSRYKTKAKIKSKTMIKMDYRKDYGCYCNIVLRKEFSFKIQDNNIIIYYPGEISSYTVKQDNLISITVGYRVEY